MSYTIVTSFVLQKKDVDNKEKINDYINRFEYIKQLNIPTILFLDNCVSVEPTDNLKIIRTCIEETWAYNFFKNILPILPQERNHGKDTLEYMIIQNSKAEWVYIASHLNPFGTDYFVWVDFGISHVISNKNNFKLLKNLKLSHDIFLSAILKTTHSDFTKKVCWRFAGGVFSINKEHTELFYKTCKNAIITLSPNITWEVNIWAYIEKNRFLKINFYYANHDDSLLLNFNPL